MAWLIGNVVVSHGEHVLVYIRHETTRYHKLTLIWYNLVFFPIISRGTRHLKFPKKQASLAKDSNVLRLSLCIGVCERRPDVARGEVAEGWWSPSRFVLDQCWECFPIHQHPCNKWNEIRSRMVDYYNKCSKKYLSELWMLWMLDSIWFNQAVGYRCTKLLLSIVICSCWLYWPPETFWQPGRVLSAVKTVKILAGVLGFLVRWCVSEEWRGLKEVGVEQDFDQLKSDMSSGVSEFVLLTIIYDYYDYY